MSVLPVPASATLVRKSAGGVDRFEGLAEVGGEGVGGGGVGPAWIWMVRWRALRGRRWDGLRHPGRVARAAPSPPGHPAGPILSAVENVAGYARKNSVWPATFGLAWTAQALRTTPPG
jgi:hypothetical protein